jgi:hypothetical protein
MLTKEQVKVIKSAKMVSARLIESKQEYPATSASELQFQVTTKIGSNEIENTVSLSVESRLYVYDQMLKNVCLKGFSFDSKHLLDLLKTVKAGDSLELVWKAGSHTSGSLKSAGFEGDSLELAVTSANKTTKYLVDVETVERDSMCRMIQPGKYDLDSRRLMI